MKATLWGGPHDGLELDVDRNAHLLRMPVTANAEAMAKPVEGDVIEKYTVPFVARYVHQERGRYLYEGQEKM